MTESRRAEGLRPGPCKRRTNRPAHGLSRGGQRPRRRAAAAGGLPDMAAATVPRLAAPGGGGGDGGAVQAAVGARGAAGGSGGGGAAGTGAGGAAGTACGRACAGSLARLRVPWRRWGTGGPCQHMAPRFQVDPSREAGRDSRIRAVWNLALKLRRRRRRQGLTVLAISDSESCGGPSAAPRHKYRALPPGTSSCRHTPPPSSFAHGHHAGASQTRRGPSQPGS